MEGRRSSPDCASPIALPCPYNPALFFVAAVDSAEFVGRFLQHVLPAGIKRIHHDGLLAPAHKNRRLTQARAALAMRAPNPIAGFNAANARLIVTDAAAATATPQAVVTTAESKAA